MGRSLGLGYLLVAANCKMWPAAFEQWQIKTCPLYPEAAAHLFIQSSVKLTQYTEPWGGESVAGVIYNISFVGQDLFPDTNTCCELSTSHLSGSVRLSSLLQEEAGHLHLAVLCRHVQRTEPFLLDTNEYASLTWTTAERWKNREED